MSRPSPRPRFRLPLLWILIGVLALAGAAYGWWRQQQAADQRAIAAAVPARPDLSTASPALQREVENAETALFSGRGDLDTLTHLAALYHANGYYDAALPLYAALQNLQPGEPKWRHRAAHIRAGFGEHEQAIPLWRDVVEAAPDYLPARIGLGEALLKSGELVEAGRVFAAVLERWPDDPHARLGLARIDVARGDWPAARNKLERVATRTEGLLGADLLATAYERTGAPERGTALRAQQKSHGMYLATEDPWIDEIMLQCFDSYRLALESGTAGLREDFARAQRLLDRALQLDPENANLHFHAGTLAEQQGDAARARQQLETAVRLDPQLTDAWAALVRVLESQGNAAGAWRTLSEGLASNPDSPVLLIERGRRLKAQGRTAAAIADLRRVTQLRRDEALAFIELASLLFAQDQVDEGIRVLEEGLRAEPGNPIALSIITFASIHAGRREEADRWWREVLVQPRVASAERLKLERAYQQKFGQSPPPAP